MSLQALMDLSSSKNMNKRGMSEERLSAQIEPLRYLISFYRQYPDYLIDFMKGPDSTFEFYFYQRIVIRIFMRHKYVYATFPRAFSKSFLAVMVLMLRCVLYPNSHLFVTTGGRDMPVIKEI